MSDGGKHLAEKTPKRGSKSKGRHAVEKPAEEKKLRSSRKAYRRRRLPAVIPLFLFMLLFCFVMISPLRGCMMDGDYIGAAAAQTIATEDAVTAADTVSDISTDMIKIDGEVYYKVHFVSSVTEYSYIINAETGSIVLNTFDTLENGK